MGGNELIRESWIGNPRVNSREEVSAGGCGRERKEAFEISAEMSIGCWKGIDWRGGGEVRRGVGTLWT